MSHNKQKEEARQRVAAMPEELCLKLHDFATEKPVLGTPVLWIDNDGYMHTDMISYRTNARNKVMKWAYLPYTGWNDMEFEHEP